MSNGHMQGSVGQIGYQQFGQGYGQPAGQAMALRSVGELELMELAAELMEVGSERELENFLGRLIKKAWRGIKKVAGGVLRPLGSVLRPLGGVLKAVAKRALPFVAGAAGTFFGGPVGGALGASLGSAISKALELEYEALEQEEKEFEMARSYVRMATDTARQAAMAPPNLDPDTAVRNAFLTIVRRLWPNISLASLGFAPNGRQGGRQNGSQGRGQGRSQAGGRSMGQGMPQGMGQGAGQRAGMGMTRRPRSGRWVRKGQTIVLFGV